MTQSSRLNLDSLPCTVEFTHITGRRVSFTVNGLSPVNELVIEMAKRGYISGELPRGGITLPLRMFPAVNFAAIGFERTFSDPGKNDEGGKLLLVRHGQMFSHRVMPENKAKKMGFKLSFSRGARKTDDESIKEGSEEISYVTAVVFKGGGHVLPELCHPGSVDGKGRILNVINTLPDANDQANLNRMLDLANTQHEQRVIQYEQSRNSPQRQAQA